MTYRLNIIVICLLANIGELIANLYFIISHSVCIEKILLNDVTYSKITISTYLYILVSINTIYILSSLLFVYYKKTGIYDIGFGISSINVIITGLWCYLFYSSDVHCEQNIEHYILSITIINIILIPIIYLVGMCINYKRQQHWNEFL